MFGAASMGALRAAELAEFGMVGVGQVYGEYRRGDLNDDDEVALVHADAACGYRPISEALVNLRATLRAAQSRGVIDARERAVLLARLKEQFYPDRSYPGLIELALHELAERGKPLANWLRDAENRVDQKHLDALELLKQLDDFRRSKPAPLAVPWVFQHTDAWELVRSKFIERQAERARATVERAGFGGLSEAPSSHGAHALLVQARERSLRVGLAKQIGFKPTPADLERSVAEFCQRRGLPDRATLRHFLAERDIDSETFGRLMLDDACVRFSAFYFEPDVDQTIADLRRVEDASMPDAEADNCSPRHEEPQSTIRN